MSDGSEGRQGDCVSDASAGATASAPHAPQKALTKGVCAECAQVQEISDSDRFKCTNCGKEQDTKQALTDHTRQVLAEVRASLGRLQNMSSDNAYNEQMEAINKESQLNDAAINRICDSHQAQIETERRAMLKKLEEFQNLIMKESTEDENPNVSK